MSAYRRAKPDVANAPEAPALVAVPPPTPRDARASRSLWGLALLVGSVVFALSRAMSASYPAPKRTLSELERATVGRAAAGQEPAWREKSRKSFPGDLWSQGDDFHNAEQSWARREARRLNVSTADVLRAVDEDLRAHPPEPPRRATVRAVQATPVLRLTPSA